MEGIALVLGCDVMKGTVARAPVYGQDSSRLLSTGLPFFQCETLTCVCVCVCLYGHISAVERDTTNPPHPLMSLQVLLCAQVHNQGGRRKWVRATTVKSIVDGHALVFK